MTARWDKLPEHLRDRDVTPKRKRPSRAKPEGPTCTFRCHACGHEEQTYPPAERHADATGHHRIICVDAIALAN